jgi:hypothetical protein
MSKGSTYNDEKTKKEIERYNKIILKAQRRGDFYSCILRFDQKSKSIRTTFMKKLETSVMWILENSIHDNMKAPQGNKATSAFVYSKASFDAYYGINKRKCIQSGIVARSAYATGSGVTSIGLDPRNAIVHHMFPDMYDMMTIMKDRVILHYEKEFGVGRVPFDCNFDKVSAKGYYNDKTTREHSDISFDSQRRVPLCNNSQKPDTPVVIAMFGDPKYLEFIKYDGPGKNTQTGVTLIFWQTTGLLVLLDPRDEYFHEKREHYWKHRSYLADGKNGAAFTFMFRVSNKTVDVHAVSGLLYAPQVGGTGKKRKQFDSGWEWMEKNIDVYMEDHLETLQKLKRRMLAHSKHYTK